MSESSTAMKRELTVPKPVSMETYHEVMLYLYREARLLDEERYREWLGLCAKDIQYWLPFRENRYRRDKRPEPGPGDSAAVYNDDYDDLEDRVRRFETGLVWSEDPPPRYSRLITNVEVVHTEKQGELAVYSNIALYRNRRQDEEIWFNGKRRDLLRRVDGDWKIARRHIFVNHHVLLDENISLLF
jgi:3-phenylpropionate/cinnamic acid dioxygenase small subunit